MTNYTFSVLATNSIGSEEAGVVMITTPSGDTTIALVRSTTISMTSQSILVTTESSITMYVYQLHQAQVLDYLRTCIRTYDSIVLPTTYIIFYQV